MNRVILALALSAFAFAASGVMDATFDDKNTVRSIRVGAAEFATGGGDLWTAEFVQGGNLTNRVKVSAHEAASFGRSYSGDGGESLVWRDIPLDGERGVLDAKVAIEKRPDGSQAWRLVFDNRSRNWKLFSTDFPRLACVTRNGEGDVMLPDCDRGARLFEKRTARSKPVRRDYLGYAPMVSAFFIGEDGLYVAAEDPEARIKSLVIEGEQNIRFTTPTELGADGSRHPVVLAPLKGDWWAAARRYRDFALRQGNLDALAYGNLLDELRFAGPVGVSTYEWLGRRPHFRLFDKTFKLPPSKFATMTDVIGNWWRTAGGEIVLLAANLTDRRQNVECRVFGTDETMRLSLAPYELVRVAAQAGGR